MEHKLIDRYIYAVTRQMPKKEVADISRELDELIASMLSERADAPGSEDEKVRQVLTELGSPGELAREYTGAVDESLIGQPYYSLYLKVLKIVLFAVALGLTVSLLVSVINDLPFADPDVSMEWFLNEFVEWFTSLFSGLLGAFAWVTIIFAILYRKGVKVDVVPYDPDNLPEVPSEKARIGRAEIIGDVIFATIFTMLFIVLPNINIPIIGMSEKPFPLFNPETLVGVRYLLIAFVVTIILEAIVKFIDGRHTVRVFAAIALTSLVSIATALTWLGNPLAINPIFGERFQELTGFSIYGFNGQPVPGFGGEWASLPLPLLIAIVVIVAASILEVVSAGLNTFQSRN
jgi:hypothetical protein